MDAIQIQKLSPDAKLPTYAHATDAGMDLYAAAETAIAPGTRALVGTGIAMAIPAGYVGLVWDKSGLAAKAGLTTFAGVIDAEYRGEISVVVYNSGDEVHTFRAGEKVAQLLVQPVMHPKLIEVADLDATARGSGGFGSTGT